MRVAVGDDEFSGLENALQRSVNPWMEHDSRRQDVSSVSDTHNVDVKVRDNSGISRVLCVRLIGIPDRIPCPNRGDGHGILV